MTKTNLLIIVLSDFSSTLSDVYKTFLSICKSTAMDSIDTDLYFDNYNSLPDEYKNLLKKHNINFTQSMHSKTYDYRVSIKSGNMFSCSFLYKGLAYLKLNKSTSVVYPEIFLQKNNNQLFVTYNNVTICGDTEFALIDNKRYNDKTSKYISSTIRDSFGLEKSLYPKLEPSEVKSYFLGKTNFLDKYDYFSHISDSISENIPSPKKQVSLKHRVHSLCDKLCFGSRFLTLIKNLLLKIYWYIFTYPKEFSKCSNQCSIVFSNLMDQEIKTLSKIAFEIKNYNTFDFYDVTEFRYSYMLSLLDAHKKISGHFCNKQYDYIMVLPWVIHGGADLFAINYLNFIAKQHPKMNILIITTIGGNITKEEAGLDKNIELLDLGSILDDQQIISDVLFSFMRNLKPKYFHILQSKAGYDCIIKSNDTEERKRTRIIYSCYNYLYDDFGHVIGYAVDELINAYRKNDTITTDNEKIKRFWVDNCGFLENDVFVHNQFFSPRSITRANNIGDTIHILWAAHIRPEKNPDIVPKIAKALNEHFKQTVYIDCYGALWDKNYNPLVDKKNINYCGGYKDFFSDIDLKKYNAFLYTSFADGTPNIIIEAALSGLPIVSSDIGGIAEVLKNNKSMVSNPNDADEFCKKIVDLLDNYEESKNIAENIRGRILKQCGEDNFTKQVKDMLGREKK